MEAEILRRSVWDEMILAGMRACYFSELVGNYQRLDKFLRLFVLLASSGAVVTALVEMDTSVRYGLLARDAADMHERWLQIESEYDRLWNALADPDGEEKFREIYGRADHLSKAGTKFPRRTKRLDYWMDYVAMTKSARYA